MGDDGRVTGWGDVDDAELIRAIQRGFELGVTFFDTADSYGAGHSERLLARALGLHNEEVVIATKFGWTFDDDGSRRGHGMDVSPAYIRSACHASLRRLQRDDIDLYQLHIGSLPDAQADEVVETLESLQAEGLIRHFGWSCDVVEQARRWADRVTCSALQFICNVLQETPGMIELCEQSRMTAIIRSPLASGFLSGKYGADARLPGDDWRAQAVERGWGDLFNPDGSGNAALAGQAGRAPRGAHRRGAHPGAGSPRLALGAQPGHRAHHRVPDRGPGRGERRGDELRSALGGPDGAHRPDPRPLIRPAPARRGPRLELGPGLAGPAPRARPQPASLRRAGRA